MILIIKGRATLVTLIGIVGMMAIGYLNHSMTDATRTASRRADSEAFGFAQSAFSHAADVRSLGLLPNLINIWGAKSADGLAASEDAARISANLYALGRAFRQILQVLIMAWGAWLVIAGDMSGGMIFMASMISGKALGPIEQVIGGWEQLTKGVEAYNSVEELTGSDKSISKRQPLPERRIASLSKVTAAANARFRKGLIGLDLLLDAERTRAQGRRWFTIHCQIRRATACLV